MKKEILISLAGACLLAVGCQTKPAATAYADYPIKDVELTHVTLTDSFWLPVIKTVQEKTIRYAFNKCAEEGRMENFVTAGKVIQGEKGKVRGRMVFDDSDLYKIIEGAAYSLVSAPNPKLDAYIDSVVGIIQQGQEADGYLSTWRTIDPQNPPSSWLKGGPRWSSLVGSHELYNAGHMYEAAAAHFHATGKRNFLDIALKNADLVCWVFGDTANYQVPGHEIIETGLIKLYQITGDDKYLLQSKKFMDLRGDSLHRELYGMYNQDHKPVTAQDEVAGHAVRAVYLYAGMTDAAVIFNDEAYRKAVNALWENMVSKKMYITGGLGARHSGESFGDNYELPNLTAYNETCAAIGGVYWDDRMFRMTGDAKYYNVLERMLYNGVLPGISLSGTEFFYPNPLASDGVYRFNQGHLTRAPWFDCSCCPTNLIRFLPYIPNLIYATEGDSTMYVNLYMSNHATIALGKRRVELTQQTAYPWDGKILVGVDTPQPETFTMKVRIPGWAIDQPVPSNLYSYVDNDSKDYAVSVNGEQITARSLEKGYLAIRREWKAGDKIEIHLPMPVRAVKANLKVVYNQTEIEQIMKDAHVAQPKAAEIASVADKVVFERGPLVYCAEEIDNPKTINALPVVSAKDMVATKEPTLLHGVVALKAKGITLIPYYAWSNRGEGKMTVYINK